MIDEEYLIRIIKQAVREVMREERQRLDSDKKIYTTDEVLSIAKVREMLSCSRSFIYNLIDKGDLEPRYIGKKPYFMLQDIENLMK